MSKISGEELNKCSKFFRAVLRELSSTERESKRVFRTSYWLRDVYIATFSTEHSLEHLAAVLKPWGLKLETDGLTRERGVFLNPLAMQKLVNEVEGVDFSVEPEAEHLTLPERSRKRAELQAALLLVRSKLKLAAHGIDVAPGVAVEPSASDLLALHRSVKELLKTAGIAA